MHCENHNMIMSTQLLPTLALPLLALQAECGYYSQSGKGSFPTERIFGCSNLLHCSLTEILVVFSSLVSCMASWHSIL